jgi:hypothetical protein
VSRFDALLTKRNGSANVRKELADGLNTGVLDRPLFDVPERGERNIRQLGEPLHLGVCQGREKRLNLIEGWNGVLLHTSTLSLPDFRCQSIPDYCVKYPSAMGADLRKVIWENIERLKDGRAKTNTAKNAKVGTATMDRMSKQESYPRLQVLERVAEFLNVEVWELLKPGGSEFSEPAKSVAEMFDALPHEQKAVAYALIVQILEFGNTGREPPPSDPTTPEPAPAPQTPPAAAPASRRAKSVP